MSATGQKGEMGGLIAARMGSSRFPGKTLADLHGRPMLERLVERLRQSGNIGSVTLATTDQSEDDTLERWCESVGVRCYRGSSDDVLGRLVSAAERFDIDPVIEVLGDNPLVHATLIDAAVARFREGAADYVATVTNEYAKADPALRRFPIGVRVQVISRGALRKCDQLATMPSEREHATSFIADHPEVFRSVFVEAEGPLADCHRPELTFAVNHPGNLDLIRHIYQVCYEATPNFGVDDAIRVFDSDATIHGLMGEPGLREDG